MGYADRYLNYPLLHTKVNDKTVDIAAEKQGKFTAAGHLHAQTLTEANSLILATIAYDLIYETLSQQQKRHVEKNFLRAMAENINFHKTGRSNWQTLVDGNSQCEADGHCLAFNFTSSYAAVTAVVMYAYENVSHTRFMLLAPNYLLVIDELKPNDEMEHTYDWLYHNKGSKTKCPLPIEDFILEEIPPGYAYLKDIKAYQPEKGQPIKIKFMGEKTSVQMTMAGEEKDGIFTATGPHTSIEDRVSMVIVRRKGHTVRFATVLEPVPSTGKNAIKKISLVLDSSLKAIVVHDQGEDHISFPEGKLENFLVRSETTLGSKIVLET